MKFQCGEEAEISVWWRSRCLFFLLSGVGMLYQLTLDFPFVDAHDIQGEFGEW